MMRKMEDSKQAKVIYICNSVVVVFKSVVIDLGMFSCCQKYYEIFGFLGFIYKLPEYIIIDEWDVSGECFESKNGKMV